MRTLLSTLTKGDLFRFPDERTVYEAHSFAINDETGVEVEYTSLVNKKRYVRTGYAAIIEVELIS